MNDELHREDLLLGRAVDGQATESDWTELELLAQHDTGVWERLAGSLRIEASLRDAVDEAVMVAEGVNLEPTLSRPWGRVLGTFGWAAAAVLLVLWLTGPADSPGPVTPLAGELPAEAPVGLDPALVHYLARGHDQGRVLGLLPAQVMQAVPAGDGENLDVIYLRGWLERARVKEVYEMGEDEHGRPASFPVSWTKYVSSGPH